jgi:hypothetical protein
MKHVNVPLPEDLHKKLRFYCVEKDTNMAEVIRKLIEEFLEKEEKKNKR